jgi:HAD superfamily phosphatase (TIGR01668 family)
MLMPNAFCCCVCGVLTWLENVGTKSPYGLVLDVDNTLARKGLYSVPPAIVSAINNARNVGLVGDVALVSNICLMLPGLVARVNYIAKQVNASVVVCAILPRIKPNPAPFAEVLNRLKTQMPEITPDRMLVVGDQLATDVAGGRGFGCLTARVDPLGPDAPCTWPRRIVERQALKLHGVCRDRTCQCEHIANGPHDD